MLTLDRDLDYYTLAVCFATGLVTVLAFTGAAWGIREVVINVKKY